jgi:type I restriction enzyme S subunit
LCFFINSEAGQNYFEQMQAGGGQKNVNAGSLRHLVVALPPTKVEQEAIAKALSDADVLIESLERLLAKKRRLKQGAMQELLSGERRLPGFGGKWQTKTLGELFHFSGGLSASRDQLSTEGHCYLHYGDIHLSSKSFIDVRADFQIIPKLRIPLKKVSVASLLADGDVVFVDASEDDEGASKHVVIVNPDNTTFISGLHTIVAKSRTAELDHLYRRYCFQPRAVKEQFRFFAVGTKVSGISKTNIAKVTIPLPSVAEQRAIAAVLSDMDAEISAVGEKLAKARQVKQGMMRALLTGSIRLV